MNELNVLFTSAGRRVSLVQEFRRAMDEMGLQGRIIAADLRKHAPAVHVADVAELVPRVSHPDYIPRLLELCKTYRIGLLVPLIDTELHLLSPHRRAFEDLGVLLLTSSTETNQICLNKTNTGRFFHEVGVDTPVILDPDAILADPHAVYPFLLKPDDGSCSMGVTKIESARELAFFRTYVNNAIVQELAQGQEYTMDAFIDTAGKVHTVVPRLRMETRAGEVSKGMTVRHDELMDQTRRVVEALPGAVGCITVQAFVAEDGTIKFIEINPRFGGGVPLSIAAGADFPRWVMELALGRQPQIAWDCWQDGLVMLRYDDAVFVNRESIT